MPPSALHLLHLDDRLAAFAKPSGMLVHRGWGDADVVAVDLVREAFGGRVHPVHRLDRATSGVLLFALDPEAAAALCGMFERGEVHKTYFALVRGVAPEEGVIDHPIPRTEDGPRVPAVTAFRRRYVFERWSLVEARPATGRLHQIRRHLKHISHPIVGDVNYGKGEINRLFRERFGLRRLALHASALRFESPFGGGEVVIRAGLPDDLQEPFGRMGIPDEAFAPT